MVKSVAPVLVILTYKAPPQLAGMLKPAQFATFKFKSCNLVASYLLTIVVTFWVEVVFVSVKVLALSAWT